MAPLRRSNRKRKPVQRLDPSWTAPQPQGLSPAAAVTKKQEPSTVGENGRYRYRGELLPPYPFLATAALSGMTLLSIMYLSPDIISEPFPATFDVLFGLAFRSKALVAFLFYAAWAAHVGEACYTMHLLSVSGWLRVSTAVPWFISVVLFGGTSMGKLLAAQKAESKAG